MHDFWRALREMIADVGWFTRDWAEWFLDMLGSRCFWHGVAGMTMLWIVSVVLTECV